MAKNDPFGFDIRVSSDKKKRQKGRRGMSGALQTSNRKCDHRGCEETGQYRAPKSPDVLDEYYWFCKDHVREYNLKWNFFHGVTEDEMTEQVDKDRVWTGRRSRSASLARNSAPGRGSASTTPIRSSARMPRSTRGNPSRALASCPRRNARRSRFSRRATTGRRRKSESSTRAW